MAKHNFKFDKPQQTDESENTPEPVAVVASAVDPEKTYTVDPAKLNVRSMPSIDSPTLRVLSSGQAVKGTKYDQDWIKLTTNGGFVMSRYLSEE